MNVKPRLGWMSVSLGLSAASLGLSMGVGAGAHAQAPCTRDADCDHGFACDLARTMACDVAVDVPCADGEICEVPQAPCEPSPAQGLCVPATDCQQDADCAQAFVCVTTAEQFCADTMPTCFGPDCIQMQADPAPCETTVSAGCAPRASQPCSEAADCGDGFECVQELLCSCASGTATPPAMQPVDPTEPMVPGSGALPLPPLPAEQMQPPTDPDDTAPQIEPPAVDAPDCGCEPAGTLRCQVLPTVCTTDADCVSGTTCEPEYGTAPCSGHAGIPMAPNTPAAPEHDGLPIDLAPVPPPPEGGSDGEPFVSADPAECMQPVRYTCMALPYDVSGHSTASDDARSAVTQRQPNPQTGNAVLSEGEQRTQSEVAADADNNDAPSPPSHRACSVSGGPGAGGTMAFVVVSLGLVKFRRRRRSR